MHLQVVIRLAVLKTHLSVLGDGVIHRSLICIADGVITPEQLQPLVPVSWVDLLSVTLLLQVEGLVRDFENLIEYLVTVEPPFLTFMLRLIDPQLLFSLEL